MLRNKWVAGLAVVGLVSSLGVSTAGVAQANPAEPVVVTQDLLDQESRVAVDLTGPYVGSYGTSGPGYTMRYIQPFVAGSTGVASPSVDVVETIGLNDGDQVGTFSLYPSASLGTFSPEFLATNEPLDTTQAVLQNGAAVGWLNYFALVEGQKYVLVFTTADVYENDGETTTRGFSVRMAPATDNDAHLVGTQLYSSTENSGYADYPYFPVTGSHPSIKVTTSPLASLEWSNRDLVDVDGTRWIATASLSEPILTLLPFCGDLVSGCTPWGFDLTGLSGPQTFSPVLTPETPTIVGSNGVKFQWKVNASVDPTAPSFFTESYERLKNSIVVDFTCTDEESGLAPNEVCGEPVSFPRGDVDRVETITVQDRAGNGSVVGLTIPALRSSAPMITVSGVQNGKTYPYGTTVKPTCQASSTLVWDLRAQSTDSESSVPCTGVTTSLKNSNGSVSWKYVATATDTDVDGGTSSITVRWTVAAKPVTAPPVVKPPVLSIGGFGTATYKGVPKVKLGKVYSNTIRVTVNGKAVVTKGAPVWLKSVASNASGTVGKPTVKGTPFGKTDTPGVWKKSTSFGKTGFRKFGVMYPNGVVVYKVVYVVR